MVRSQSLKHFKQTFQSSLCAILFLPCLIFYHSLGSEFILFKEVAQMSFCLVFSNIERLRWIKLMGEHIRERTQSSSLRKLFTLGQDERRESQAEQESHIILWWNLRKMCSGVVAASCRVWHNFWGDFIRISLLLVLNAIKYLRSLFGIRTKYFDSLVFAIVFSQQ